MMRILHETNINFIGNRKYAFVFSGILVALGIISFALILMGKANLGLDFTGGAELIGSFQKPVTAQQLRSALDQVGYGQGNYSICYRRQSPELIYYQGPGKHRECHCPKPPLPSDGKPMVNMVAAEGDKLANKIKDRH